MVKNVMIVFFLMVSSLLSAQGDYSSADQTLNEQEQEMTGMFDRQSKIGVEQRGMDLPNDPGTVPVGEGLIILSVLGAGYAFARKRKS